MVRTAFQFMKKFLSNARTVMMFLFKLRFNALHLFGQFVLDALQFGEVCFEIVDRLPEGLFRRLLIFLGILLN